MTSIKAEFYSGTQGQLFRLLRTPKQIKSHLLFIPPLFEQANKTRHHITRSANNAYHQGIASIIFDHFGTGDSEGELSQVNLALWQADILKQIKELKASSPQNIFLSIPLSASLLLSTQILNEVDAVMLQQAEFNGKSFVKQLKRLNVVAELNHAKSVSTEQATKTNDNSALLDIAGYQIPTSLLAELSEQCVAMIATSDTPCYWFEWQNSTQALSPNRFKQQQLFASKIKHLTVITSLDCKFWLASELQLAHDFLAQEQQLFIQLLNREDSYE